MELMDAFLIFWAGLGLGWCGSCTVDLIVENKAGQAVGMSLLGLFNAHIAIYAFI